ncbi:hypothetical protein J1605_022648, partial [Eschrichtius robustus]|jgi:ribonuclease P/MRP protein subunit POP1
VA